MVDKPNIWKMWDGGREELEALATYNLDDSFALERVYETFIPIMIELARLTYDPLTDVCVSTTGQLVEFMMMHSSCQNGELIPNKPDERESRDRLRSPIEGAYVKTPEPGIYNNLVMFDFRGLYPSIIISYNIDPSTVVKEGADTYDSPDGTRFTKSRKGIMPALLQMMMNQSAHGQEGIQEGSVQHTPGVKVHGAEDSVEFLLRLPGLREVKVVFQALRRKRDRVREAVHK